VARAAPLGGLVELHGAMRRRRRWRPRGLLFVVLGAAVVVGVGARLLAGGGHAAPAGARSGSAARSTPGGKGSAASRAAAAIPSLDGLPAVQYSPSHLPPAWPGAAGRALPYPVLIADRGNNRMLEVTPDKQLVWQYPAPGSSAGHFAYDDDTFFTPDGSSIITNEEDEADIAQIDYYTQKKTWSYGVYGVPGYYNGHLNYPDDAYRLPDGTTITADIRNCRELFISPQDTILQQWGVNQHPWLHYCATNITSSAQTSELGYPNGDTPQPNGDILMSIINGNWIVLFSPTGQTLWKAQAPDIPDNGCQYVSDAQLLSNGDVLVADYAGPTGNSSGCPAVPGQVIEFNPQTLQVVWRYDVASGNGELNHPSLAEQLPNGNIILNDDYNDRVIVIDPHTNQIVWQYGVTGQVGTAPGYLNTPDGLAVDVYRNWYGWLQQHPQAAASPAAAAG
jgi:outer membrane protein assembly factor BamB